MSDPDAAEAVGTRTYRAALWSFRVACLVGLAWIWTALVVAPSGLVLLLIWLAGAAASVTTIVLLRRSGPPFALMPVSAILTDPVSMREFYRDVFRWRRR
ncbi:hypothetical protein [Actinophytocola sp.]|uniref:hypothetical protein n=1 Tax=Actinophytocola sp. TaxID=1872138 RepID=UPI002D7E833E|nr:hypothetical protein [Actinophytocola sp.]HET9139386.1 hypothetical protein [Actinophytocola sp.]